MLEYKSCEYCNGTGLDPNNPSNYDMSANAKRAFCPVCGGLAGGMEYRPDQPKPNKKSEPSLPKDSVVVFGGFISILVGGLVFWVVYQSSQKLILGLVVAFISYLIIAKVLSGPLYGFISLLLKIMRFALISGLILFILYLFFE